MIIYRIINTVNNKSYIGQTINSLTTRKSQHMNIAFKSNAQTALHRAIRKYGKENFKWEIICECKTIDELNDKEQYYVNVYNSFGNYGYNMTSGGEGYTVSTEGRKNMSNSKSGKNNPLYGKTHSEKTKIKMRKSAAGRKQSEKAKQKLRELYLGKTYEELYGEERANDIKQKLSESNMGHFVSDETRKKIGKIHRGKIVSETTREKIRLANSGKRHSDGAKHKISKAFSGIKWPIVVCPHCNKSGGSNVMSRWHFDNCRDKNE